jgi:uncharacterized membrane protein
MKKIFILLALSLLAWGCEQRLSAESFENRTVVLSMHEITLEPLQSEDFFVGMSNEFAENATFLISAVCITNNCEGNIVVQTFPVFSLSAGQKAAFPIRVEALENIKKGEYSVKIIVKLDNRTYDSDEFTVDVPAGLEQIKKEAIQTIIR